ncbi:hypothetical protein IPC1020_17140 [Pseudomonas aeruginosa]|nr:hypothetical protein [Pseudomonas aeruginosa]RPM81954.1 hypothetical protein IPC1280_20205 [Pseudomonas aeruginosa]RPS04653.1 hypothetical protein IPC1020_17140 [Pseudomonas aeruginosa]
MTVAKNDAEEGGGDEQFADRASRLDQAPFGSWLPVGDSLSSLSIWLIRKRFPVPQDNFVPVAISSSRLVGRSTRWRPRAYRRRHRELVVSEPLISGSGAIMLWKKSVVKRFVVFFQDYYTKV